MKIKSFGVGYCDGVGFEDNNGTAYGVSYGRGGGDVNGTSSDVDCYDRDGYGYNDGDGYGSGSGDGDGNGRVVMVKNKLIWL